MNTKSVDAIANAVLYEGYMLYPYRASSVKNRQRFNFGVLYPKAYSEMQSGSDAWTTRTECLVEGSSQSAIEIKVRFLKLVERVTEAKESEAVPPWQEAIECEVAVPICSLGALVSTALSWPFSFPAQRDVEVLRGTSHEVTGKIIRSQAFLEGRVQITAEPVAPGLFKVRVVVQNLTAFDSREGTREQALMQSLVSAHTLLGVVGWSVCVSAGTTRQPERSRGKLPESRSLAGFGRRRRRARHHAFVAYHSLRLSADCAGESGRFVRWDGDR